MIDKTNQYIHLEFSLKICHWCVVLALLYILQFWWRHMKTNNTRHQSLPFYLLIWNIWNIPQISNLVVLWTPLTFNVEKLEQLNRTGKKFNFSLCVASETHKDLKTPYEFLVAYDFSFNTLSSTITKSQSARQILTVIVKKLITATYALHVPSWLDFCPQVGYSCMSSFLQLECPPVTGHARPIKANITDIYHPQPCRLFIRSIGYAVKLSNHHRWNRDV